MRCASSLVLALQGAGVVMSTSTRRQRFESFLKKNAPAHEEDYGLVEFSADDEATVLEMFKTDEKLKAAAGGDWRRAKEAWRFLKDKSAGCPDKEATFNSAKLHCDMDGNGWDSKCRCADSSKTLTPVKPCDVNHCGGAYSTSCLGIQDQKSAWVNEFLSEAFMPVFNSCCDTHDEGYCVPGTSKISVDKAFLGCMQNKCDSDHDQKVREECSEQEKCRGWGRRRSCRKERKCKKVNRMKNKWCKLRAKIAYTAVERGGLKAFNAKQDVMMECQ